MTAEAINLADQIAALERVERGEGTSGDFDLIADRWDLRERIIIALRHQLR